MLQRFEKLKSIKGYTDERENKNFMGVFNGHHVLTDINDLKNSKFNKGDNFMWF